MSARMMGMVFDRYPGQGGELVLALAMADHAHDDGTHIFAYVSSLAAKSRQSVRTVQVQLDKMRRRGWLLRVGESHGGRGKAAQYRINPDWIKGQELAPLIDGEEAATNSAEKGAEAAPFAPVDNPGEDGIKGAEAAPFEKERVQAATQKGAVAAAPAIEPYEPIPNTNTPQPPKGADPADNSRAGTRGGVWGGEPSLLSLDEWLAGCEARGEAPVPAEHPVHEFARVAGISAQWLAIAWAEWVQQKRGVAKRQRNWPDAFEVAVRRNLMMLWVVPKGLGNKLVLSTAGIQASQVHGCVPLLAPVPEPVPMSYDDKLSEEEKAALRAERRLLFMDPELRKREEEAKAWGEAEKERAIERSRALRAKVRGKGAGGESACR